MKSRIIFLLQGLFLLSLFLGEVALAQSTKRALPAGQAPGTFDVKVSQGYLSLEANQAPLMQIFQEIEKQGEDPHRTN